MRCCNKEGGDLRVRRGWLGSEWEGCGMDGEDDFRSHTVEKVISERISMERKREEIIASLHSPHLAHRSDGDSLSLKL